MGIGIFSHWFEDEGMGVNRSSDYKSTSLQNAYDQNSLLEEKIRSLTKLLSKNPDPKNFKVKLVIEMGNYVIAKIHYPNCSSFEGMKICVYKGCSGNDIKNAKELDPHFSGGTLSYNGTKKPVPFARFSPDQLDLAVKFVESLCS